VTLGDLNDDGKLDAVVANRALSNISVLLGDGTGGFAAPMVTSNIRPSSIALGDLNADGKLDAVVTSANGALTLLGDGTGNLSRVPALLFTGSDGVTLGDLNNDGKLDALMDTSSGFVSLLLGDGVGSFGTGSLLRLSAGGRTTAALGDVNGDGKLDVLITSLDFRSVAVRLGDGAGGFTNGPSFSADTPQSVKLGDFDGDGKLDALVVNSTFVSVMRGDGTGGFSAAQDFAIATNPRAAALGDLNNDGKLDALVANLGSSDLSVLLNPDFGNTLGFGNSSATVTVANDNSLNSINGDYTVELWAKIPSSLSTTDGILYNLLGKQAGDPTQAANANNSLPFRLFVQNGQIGGALCTIDPDANVCRATTILSSLPKPLNDNAWHHFALVRQRGIGTQSLSLLVDGVQVGSIANVFSSSDQIGNTAPLTLGTDSFSPGFGGALDEVRIWNVARTIAEISAGRMPISAPYPANLLAYFKLNSSSGTTALNEITGGSSGTLLNFPAGNPWQLR
jgi:Concanavalin A-like lectin/glucanases superfamily/FG-GAP-like repeat